MEKTANEDLLVRMDNLEKTELMVKTVLTERTENRGSKDPPVSAALMVPKDLLDLLEKTEPKVPKVNSTYQRIFLLNNTQAFKEKGARRAIEVIPAKMACTPMNSGTLGETLPTTSPTTPTLSKTASKREVAW